MRPYDRLASVAKAWRCSSPRDAVPEGGEVLTRSMVCPVCVAAIITSQGPTISAVVTSATAVKMALDKRQTTPPQKLPAVRAAKVEARAPKPSLSSRSSQ
ncbi:hypothetical protein WJX73_006253 [Symbiochloris irregularis]|uniref:Uncharacterized protein n=1 Tax=Symbiochloris irregularis TaxID=706552 RepID=A0AAW1PI66_9CHLO